MTSQSYNRAGRSHANADSLSRRPCNKCSQCDIVDGNFQASETVASGEHKEEREESAEVKVVTLEPTLSNVDLQREQAKDSSLRWILESKRRSEDRPDWPTMSSRSSVEKCYWRIWNQLDLKNNVLYRKWESEEGDEVRWHVVLPASLRKEVVQELHGGKSGGHFGVRKTRAKVRLRFYWVGMDADIRSMVRQCDVCARRKSHPKRKKAPLQQKVVDSKQCYIPTKDAILRLEKTRNHSLQS